MPHTVECLLDVKGNDSIFLLGAQCIIPPLSNIALSFSDIDTDFRKKKANSVSIPFQKKVNSDANNQFSPSKR